MAKGNDGNYLQHCIEIESAVLLAQTEPEGRLHVALTHGMEPFERLGESKRYVRHSLLCGALHEATGEPLRDERKIVKAYRESWASKAYHPNIEDMFAVRTEEKCYPNTAELLRAVIGVDRLPGGIAETDEKKHKKLAEAWSSSGIVVANSSWREQLGPDGALSCPDGLDAPWLFSMDPMTFTDDGREDDDKLHRSDLDLLARSFERYVDSGQPGIASLFVYSVGTQGKTPQQQFWMFMDDLARSLGVRTCSYWVAHQGGNLNLASLLFSDTELAFGFVPPRIKPGRGRESMKVPGGWSRWLVFPDPDDGGYLSAPFGPGVYELRNRRTGEMVLVGESKNVAYRMSSLFPAPSGTGGRSNADKRKYVLSNLRDIEYRTMACKSKEEASRAENALRRENRSVVSQQLFEQIQLVK